MKENVRRLAEFKKSEQLESYFDALNDTLANAKIPAPSVDSRSKNLPIIYIIGAPRSGTTLAHQMVSRFMKAGYINNLIARFWRRPDVGILLSKAILNDDSRENILLSSVHGVCHGAEGPHEFGYFWNYWLKREDDMPHCLSDAELGAIDLVGLKNALENEILSSFGMPVVLKNLLCGVNAAYLAKAHSNSIFINIKRDSLDTISSILRVRKERYGSYDTWWSLKPPTFPFDDIKDDPVREVVRQLSDIRKRVDEQLETPGVKSITVKYEDLCLNCEGVLEVLSAKIGEMGFECERVGGPLPKLEIRKRKPLESHIEDKLKTYHIDIEAIK